MKKAKTQDQRRKNYTGDEENGESLQRLRYSAPRDKRPRPRRKFSFGHWLLAELAGCSILPSIAVGRTR